MSCFFYFSGAFRLYDVDNDGFITRDEMYNIVDAIYQMVVSRSIAGNKLLTLKAPEVLTLNYNYPEALMICESFQEYLTLYVRLKLKYLTFTSNSLENYVLFQFLIKQNIILISFYLLNHAVI